jgi:DNA-binding NtrC family response regulator
MGASLPAAVRARFMERPDLVALAAFEARLGEPPARPWTRVPPASTPMAAVRGPGRILGHDPTIAALRQSIQRVASTGEIVLIRGESGTGKELVAQAVHEASARSKGPMVAVNCAALVETLLHSELFGHEKGAFTGADARRRGRFEEAGGGTLFLDEIGDISPNTQVALLRVLQDKTFQRVGGTRTLSTDCRVVCATHRDLEAMVARGELRQDLYQRLKCFVLHVPPLRRRPGDLPLLAQSILRRIAAERGEPLKRLSPAALTGLARHTWPGNVRELENALRAATLFADGEVLELADFASNVEGLGALIGSSGGSGDAAEVLATIARSPESVDPPPSSPTQLLYERVRRRPAGTSFEDMERSLESELIAMALAEAGGNITRAAELLGRKRSRLSQLVQEYKLSHLVKRPGLRSADAVSEEVES